jgi:hypothetical protein
MDQLHTADCLLLLIYLFALPESRKDQRMNLKSRILIPAIILTSGLVLLTVAGCTRSSPGNVAQKASTSAPSPSPSPKQITTAELAKLRWIEGSWRGTGGGVPPFYERYKFENDSTLVVEGLADETLSKVNDVSRFELKDGHFGSGTDDSGSVAIALDDNSITFAPLGKGNFFRFQRESDNSWKAILNWTDKTGAPKERIYLMERITPRNP